jgi:hypothetical protein
MSDSDFWVPQTLRNAPQCSFVRRLCLKHGNVQGVLVASAHERVAEDVAQSHCPIYLSNRSTLFVVQLDTLLQLIPKEVRPAAPPWAIAALLDRSPVLPHHSPSNRLFFARSGRRFLMEVLNPTGSCEFVTSPEELVAPTISNDDREGSDDSDTLSEEVDVERRNEELQKLFEEKMDNVGSQRSHLKVAVLLISWEPEREDYIDAGAEVCLSLRITYGE